MYEEDETMAKETNINWREKTLKGVDCYVELFHKCGLNNTVVKMKNINFDNVIQFCKSLKEMKDGIHG